MLASLIAGLKSQLDERAKLVRWHRQNACRRQGLPYEDDVSDLNIKVDASELTAAFDRHREQQSQQVATEPSNPLGPFEHPGQRGLLQRALPYILSAAIGASGIAFGTWMSKNSSTTSHVQQQSPLNDGSLLQWLEDQGEHVP